MIDDFTISTEALEFCSGQNEVLCICLFNINWSTALHCSKPSSGLASHFNSGFPYIFYALISPRLSPHLLSSSHLLSNAPIGEPLVTSGPFHLLLLLGEKQFLLCFCFYHLLLSSSPVSIQNVPFSGKWLAYSSYNILGFS